MNLGPLSKFWLIALCLAATACASDFHRSAHVAGTYQVRIAYIIPTDRTTQDNYEKKVETLVGWVQKFYADQMECNGFGRRTFAIESDSSRRPLVHVIHSPLTASVFADVGHVRYATGKYWDHTLQALTKGGFTPYHPGEVWLCFVEAQSQASDGQPVNDTTQGAGEFGSGVALCSGMELQLADPELLADHRPYGGLIVPQIGPHRLISHISFPDYDGDDVSSLAADSVSAVTHELGHCFLLEHCFVNDQTQNGNLMGNGFRGWRGYFMPNKFPNEDTRLDRASALQLKLCPFFRNLEHLLPDEEPPRVSLDVRPGTIDLERGAFRLPFAASTSGSGIALATLENGLSKDGVGIVAWREFDGKSTSLQSFISTSMMTAGQRDTWRLRVFDVNGNFAEKTIKMTAPNNGIGPTPFISVNHSTIRVGERLQLRSDRSEPENCRFRWSFGDGTESFEPSVKHLYARPGVFEVRLTATDSNGNQSQISQFICVKSAVTRH